jgi:Ni/Co efflux regulator RcnB
MNKKRNFHYFVGILIAVGLYLLNTIFCSTVNVLISGSAGYGEYSEFQLSREPNIILAFIFNSLCSHVLVARITVSAMTAYGAKRNCVNMRYFSCSATAVLLFAAIIIPVISGTKPGTGWVIYTLHAICLEVFGKGKCKAIDETNSDISNTEEQQETESADKVEPSANTKKDTTAEVTDNSAQDNPANAGICIPCSKVSDDSPVNEEISDIKTIPEEVETGLEESNSEQKAENSSFDEPQGKGKKFFTKSSLILSIILAVLLIASISVNLVQHTQSLEQIDQLNAQLNTKANEVQELEETVKSMEETAKTNKKKVSELEDKVSALNDKVTSQRTTISKLKTKSGYFDRICAEINSGNLGYASDSFKSSESIIVVKRSNKTKKIKLTASWKKGGTVSTSYSGTSATVSFDKHSWSKTVTLTIKPRTQGITTVTFSSDADSKKFKILIIVT